jgi:hypothetical protein
MISFGLIPTLINNLIFREEGGASHDPHVQGVDTNYGDMETIVSTTKHHKQRGKPSSEINSQSLIFSHRNIFPKINSQSTMTQQRNPSSNTSDDDGEINPPQGILETLIN